MHYDLTDEHATAYNQPTCGVIDNLTNLFDEILDYLVPAMYPNMSCVDVFPCSSDMKREIPKLIQKYFDVDCSEDFEERMQSAFGEEMVLENPLEGDLCTVLGDIFSYSLVRRNSVNITQEQLDVKIRNVSNMLKQITGADTVLRYSIGKDSMGVLEKLYIGILTSGYVLSCGDFSIMILIGTNE